MKTTPRILTGLAGAAAALTAMAVPASAHGSMQYPLSRVLTCYKQNPEAPKAAACKAAVAAGGKQAMYDWNGVRIGDVAGRHRQRIPNGRLCSANNPEFKGLDLPRADWPATTLKAGAALDFRYAVTAQHKGTFQVFITKNGFNPAKPLKWSDLDSKPFLVKTGPAAVNGFYDLKGKIPAGKKGRHIIYAIWQRSDSPEAFYSCSDIVIGKTSAKPASGGTTRSTGSKTAKPDAVPPAPKNDHCHDGASPSTTLRTVHTASDSPSNGDPFGTGLIGGAIGLALGGVSGLLLTARRRRTHAGS